MKVAASTRSEELARPLQLFVGLYFFLYLLPFPLTAFPHLDFLTSFAQVAWDRAFVWFATHILRAVLPADGPGDSQGAGLDVLFTAAVALALTLAVSFARSRSSFVAQSNQWLRVYLRFGLAAQMIWYGMIKIFPQQFPFPRLERACLQPSEILRRTGFCGPSWDIPALTPLGPARSNSRALCSSAFAKPPRLARCSSSSRWRT